MGDDRGIVAASPVVASTPVGISRATTRAARGVTSLTIRVTAAISAGRPGRAPVPKIASSTTSASPSADCSASGPSNIVNPCRPASPSPGGPQRPDRDMKSLTGQRPRRDHAIAAVISRAEQHNHSRAGVPDHVANRPRDARTRLLHEGGASTPRANAASSNERISAAVTTRISHSPRLFVARVVRRSGIGTVPDDERGGKVATMGDAHMPFQ